MEHETTAMVVGALAVASLAALITAFYITEVKHATVVHGFARLWRAATRRLRRRSTPTENREAASAWESEGGHTGIRSPS